MSHTVRFAVSLDSKLLESFDRVIENLNRLGIAGC